MADKVKTCIHCGDGEFFEDYLDHQRDGTIVVLICKTCQLNFEVFPLYDPRICSRRETDPSQSGNNEPEVGFLLYAEAMKSNPLILKSVLDAKKDDVSRCLLAGVEFSVSFDTNHEVFFCWAQEKDLKTTMDSMLLGKVDGVDYIHTRTCSVEKMSWNFFRKMWLGEIDMKEKFVAVKKSVMSEQRSVLFPSVFYDIHLIDGVDFTDGKREARKADLLLLAKDSFFTYRCSSDKKLLIHSLHGSITVYAGSASVKNSVQSMMKTRIRLERNRYLVNVDGGVLYFHADSMAAAVVVMQYHHRMQAKILSDDEPSSLRFSADAVSINKGQTSSTVNMKWRNMCDERTSQLAGLIPKSSYDVIHRFLKVEKSFDSLGDYNNTHHIIDQCHCLENLSEEDKADESVRTCLDCSCPQREVTVVCKLHCSEIVKNHLTVRKCRNNILYFPTDGYKVKIMDCGFKGWGLVTDEVIPVNSIIIEYIGEIITAAEYERRNGIRGKEKMYFAIMGSLVIDASCIGNSSRFANHSCCGHENARLEKLEVPKKKPVGKKKTVIAELHLILRAVREIEANEEITYVYDLKTDDFLNYGCVCESHPVSV